MPKKRTYQLIEPTEEEYKKREKSDLLNKWAKPVMEEVEKYFKENPNARAVRIRGFPEELKDEEKSYKIRGKDVTRIISRAQRAFPLLGAYFRTNKELRGKYKLQLSEDKSTINIYRNINVYYVKE
jgi:hypothetical protein